MDRRILPVLASVALALAALLLLRPVGSGAPAEELRARIHGPPPSPSPGLGPLQRLARDLEALARRTTRLRVLTLDAADEPIPGVELRLGEHRGVTDAGGELIWEDAPFANGSSLEVEGPWLLLEGSSRGFVQGLEQTRVLWLEPACPGDLRLVDERGRPVEGAEISMGDLGRYPRAPGGTRVATTDARGVLELPLRPCGRSAYRVRPEPGSMVLRLEGEVRGGERLTLALPPHSEAVLLLRDAEGGVLDGSVDKTPRFDAERLGPGRYLLRSRRAFATAAVTIPGYPVALVELPLDGGEHVYTVRGERRVEVVLRCDDCPERFQCSHNPCERLGDARWDCPCPQDEAFLSGEHNTLLGRVPPGVDRVELELRTTAVVRGRWTGGLPCYARGEHSRYLHAACAPDGRFELDGLRAGPNTVIVRAGPREQGSAHLVLEAGETLDIGAIDPDEGPVDGVIDADFPLVGAVLFCSPSARAELEPDGGFLLHGLAPEAEWVDLHLWSSLYGSHRARLEIPAGGSLPTWTVRFAELGREQLEEPAPGSEDTGGPWDSGWLGDSG